MTLAPRHRTRLPSRDGYPAFLTAPGAETRTGPLLISHCPAADKLEDHVLPSVDRIVETVSKAL